MQWGRTFARELLLVGLLGAKYVTCAGDQLDCLRATRAVDDGLAAVVCEREYHQTDDPATGARLANALRRSGKPDSAEALANVLLATPARADALQVLGKIALDKGQLDVALSRLRTARTFHLAEPRLDRVAADDQAIAGVFMRRKQFADALRSLDDCIVEARQGEDRLIEGYCHMSAASVLAEVGYFEGAQEKLQDASSLLESDRDRAALEHESGWLLQRHGFGPSRHDDNLFAVRSFERAIAYARKAKRPGDEASAELNLAYSLAEVGRFDEAVSHLETARLLDVSGEGADECALVQARIAYRRGDFALATSINTATYDRLTDDDFRLDVCVMQARIAITANNLELATMWANRGVEVAERLRGEVSAIELRPWVLSTRRQPYELLFTALVGSHKLEDAVVAFDHWQARTLLDSSLRDRHGHVDLKIAAGDTERYHRVFPMLSNAPVMQPIAPAALLGRLRGVDLVAMVVAENEVWRIVANHGALDIVDVGPVAALQPVLARFATTPTSVDLADQLGVKLLGAEAFRDTDETLLVVLDGQLARVPIAALRAGGRPLIAMRPVLRAPRMSEVGCIARRPGARHAVVMADVIGDLPGAALEAREIAAGFGVAPVLGAAATRDALFAATKDDVLHVAVHASVELGLGVLQLHDQQVSALEIAGHGGGPALVVLAACVSAIADDGEQATSLANAFLAAGSAQVVATLRPIGDAGARELMHRFYREGGVADPARALARIQAALAATSTNADWPNFVLFGHDTCQKETP